MVKTQRKIEFINDCGAIVDFKELEKAILWRSEKPTISKKHIYLHGLYPAVSIGKEKIHIHRLLMMYWLNTDIPTEFSVHHLDRNRLNATKENLSLMLNSSHNSKHSKGREITDKMRKRIIETNHSRKGTRHQYGRKDVSIEKIKELTEKGYNTNKISKILGCDWNTVKARQKDLENEYIEGGRK